MTIDPVTVLENMKQNGVDAVVIPQTDPHHGEYIADHWQLRRHISGFTGSAAMPQLTLVQDLRRLRLRGAALAARVHQRLQHGHKFFPVLRQHFQFGHNAYLTHKRSSFGMGLA